MLNQTNIILNTIAALSVNSPVIRHWGLNLGPPICLVLLNGIEMEPILSYFGMADRLITVSTPAKRVHSIMGAADHYPVAMYFGDSMTAEITNRFGILESAEATGRTRGGPFRSIAIVLVKDKVPSAIQDRVFPIFIEEPPKGVVDYEKLVPDENVLPNILASVEKHEEETPYTRSFRCILQFLIYSIIDHDYATFCDYSLAIDGIMDEYLTTTDAKLIEQIFIKKLFLWAKDKDFHELYRLEDLSSDMDFRRMMAFDDRYLYIGETLFMDISDATHIAHDRLKRELAAVEPPLLVRQERGCYTSKLPVDLNEVERHCAPRMLRFDLSRINQGRGGGNVMSGLLTFQQLHERRRVENVK